MKYLAGNNLFAYSDDILGSDSPPNTRSDQPATSSVGLASSLYLITFFEGDEGRRPQIAKPAQTQGSSLGPLVTNSNQKLLSCVPSSSSSNHRHLVGVKIAGGRLVDPSSRYRQNQHLQRKADLGNISCSTSDGEDNECEIELENREHSREQDLLLQESLSHINLSVGSRLGYWSASSHGSRLKTNELSCINPNENCEESTSCKNQIDNESLVSSIITKTDSIQTSQSRDNDPERDSFFLVLGDGANNHFIDKHSPPRKSVDAGDSSDDGWVLVDSETNESTSLHSPSLRALPPVASKEDLIQTGSRTEETKTIPTTAIDQKLTEIQLNKGTSAEQQQQQQPLHQGYTELAFEEEVDLATFKRSRTKHQIRSSRLVNPRLAQMALDKIDLDLIRASWLPVRKDPTSHAIQLFKGLFTKFPKYLAFFPQFSNLDLDKMQENKRLVRHAVKVIETVTFVVDSVGVESKADELNEALVNLVKGHLRRQIGLTEFRNLGVVIIDFICDLNQRRSVSPPGDIDQIQRRCTLATVTPSSAMCQITSPVEVGSLAKSASTTHSDSGNMSSASGDLELTMTSALDKIQTSSTPSSSSEDDSLKVSQQPTHKPCPGVDRRSSELPVDTYRHVGKLDTDGLVAAWTKLYGCILELVRREEEQAARLDGA